MSTVAEKPTGNEEMETEKEKVEEEETENVSKTGNSGGLTGKRAEADMGQTFEILSKYCWESEWVGGFGVGKGEGVKEVTHMGQFLKQSSFGAGHVRGDQVQETSVHAINPTVVRSAPMATPTTAPDSTTQAQLTIFYSGTVHVYDDIPAEKVQAIMLLAAAAAANAKKGVGSAQPSALTRAPSFKSTSAQVRPSPKNCLRNLQADLPLARILSLQRFLEKRRES